MSGCVGVSPPQAWWWKGEEDQYQTNIYASHSLYSPYNEPSQAQQRPRPLSLSLPHHHQTQNPLSKESTGDLPTALRRIWFGTLVSMCSVFCLLLDIWDVDRDVELTAFFIYINSNLTPCVHFWRAKAINWLLITWSPPIVNIQIRTSNYKL